MISKASYLLFLGLTIFSIRLSACEETIDGILAREYEKHGIEPSSRCSDAVFLRRITLDLAGRIPTLEEVRDFQSNPNRIEKIEQLLKEPIFASSWSEIWSANWIGYGENNGIDRELFRSWIESSLREEVPYDKMVRQLISANGNTALDGNTVFLLRHQNEPAIQVSRTFLGIRLDCARCHDHPFDHWKKENYEQFSRFFQGMRIRQISDRATELFEEVEQAKRTPLEERPRFLTDARPRTPLWRDELSLFITNSKPFARAFANRVWYQLMGRGIFNPPDDLSRANAPISPELLEYLSERARSNRFDIKGMIREICCSDAYQRVSAIKGSTPEELNWFASRTIKPMTVEQSIDALGIAVGQAWSLQERQQFIQSVVGATGEESLSSTWDYREAVQALMLRLNTPVKSPEKNIDDLYLRILCRMPSEEERLICSNQKLDDVAFALVNSNEFYFNH